LDAYRAVLQRLDLEPLNFLTYKLIIPTPMDMTKVIRKRTGKAIRKNLSR